VLTSRVDNELNSIKGGGACQLREKVLAEAAETWILVADYRKNSEILGTNWTQGIPIEVAPFAYAKVLDNLALLGSPSVLPNGKPGLSLRMGLRKAGPVVSDNGMFIIDAPFSQEMMKDPADVSIPTHPKLTIQLLHRIKMLTGVVEVGLFVKMAKAAYFGNEVCARRCNAGKWKTDEQDGSVSIRHEDGSLEKLTESPAVLV
jgi:ribose 5-phosphate isomerase A